MFATVSPSGFLCTKFSIYLANHTRYGRSYNGRRTETRIYRMVPFPMTSNLSFEVTVFFNVKQLNNGILQWQIYA